MSYLESIEIPHKYRSTMPNCLCPLKDAALDAPHQLALTDGNFSLSFSQLDAQTDEMKQRLQSAGIQEGSLIASHCPTDSRLISLFFAAWRLKASICPLSLYFPPAQISTYLSRLSPQLFIPSWDAWQKTNVPTLPIHSSLFLFTSGSMALPKIAVLPLQNLIANAFPLIQILALQPNDRWLLSLPLYHVGGISILIRSILARAAIALNPQDPHITHLSWVPTQLYRSTPIYKKLKCLLLGGAPTPKISSALPISISYGLTEMSSLVTCNQKILKNREVSLAPDGEILVRGPCLFQGYWRDSNLEKPFDANGWFKTGDLGKQSSSEDLYIQGRKDWQFISGGENIQPEEIENALLSIEEILEAAVLPKPDPEFGARPVAFVKTSNPHFNLERMEKILLDQLPKYKIPTTLFLVDEMPKAGMKIDKKTLRNTLNINSM